MNYPLEFLKKELDARKKYLSLLMERYDHTNIESGNLKNKIEETRLEIEAFNAAVEALKTGGGNVDSKD